MLLDTHCHLNDDQLRPTRQQHRDDFIAAGGRALLVPATDLTTLPRALQIAEESSQISNFSCGACVGFHPGTVAVDGRTDFSQPLAQLRTILAQNLDAVRAVGECGLDLHYPAGPATLPLQQKFLTAQAELAREFSLPLVIHARDCFDEILETLRDFRTQKIYLHCRSFGAPELQKFLTNFPDSRVGFCANLAHDTEAQIRAAAREVPLDRVFLETDAPYLRPPQQPRPNRPSFVQFHYDFFAQIREIPVAELAPQIFQNFKTFFPTKF